MKYQQRNRTLSLSINCPFDDKSMKSTEQEEVKGLGKGFRLLCETDKS